jgi:hypothetical protein
MENATVKEMDRVAAWFVFLKLNHPWGGGLHPTLKCSLEITPLHSIDLINGKIREKYTQSGTRLVDLKRDHPGVGGSEATTYPKMFQISPTIYSFNLIFCK